MVTIHSRFIIDKSLTQIFDIMRYSSYAFLHKLHLFVRSFLFFIRCQLSFSKIIRHKGTQSVIPNWKFHEVFGYSEKHEWNNSQQWLYWIEFEVNIRVNVVSIQKTRTINKLIWSDKQAREITTTTTTPTRRHIFHACTQSIKSTGKTIDPVWFRSAVVALVSWWRKNFASEFLF